MNIESLKKAGIEYEDGLSRFSGSTALYEKYLRRYISIDMIQNMKQAYKEGNIETAFQECHKLKAFVGNLSIPSLYEDVDYLTDIFRKGHVEDTKDCEIRLERIESNYQRIREVLIKELDGE